MWTFIKILARMSLGLFGVFIVHIAVTNGLLFPLNHINVIILFLAWEFIYLQKPNALWLAFGLSFFLELFSGLAFGITTFIVICTLLGTRLVFNFLFSEFRPIVIFLLGALTPFFAEILTYITVNVNLVIRGNALMPFSDLTTSVVTIIINGVVMVVIYGIRSVIKYPGAQRSKQYSL